MIRVAVTAVALVDDASPAYEAAVRAGVDVLDAIEGDARLALTEPSADGEDLWIPVELDQFTFEATPVATGPDSRCGIHGDPTSSGRCASCDAHVAGLMVPVTEAVADVRAFARQYETPAEVLFAAAVAIVGRYVAAGGSDLDTTLQAIGENLEGLR